MDSREDKLNDQVAFANMGKQVIDNEAYKQAITIRKAQIFEIFCKTKRDQVDVREEAWRTMQNMNALESFFSHALTTGEMANSELEAINKHNQNKKTDR